VIDSAFAVHRELGPGLLERVYQTCLCHELKLRSILFAREVPLNVRYKGLEFEAAYRLDLLVADCLIVELKSVEQMLPVHEAQLMSYLRLSGKLLGLLINLTCRSSRTAYAVLPTTPADR